MKETWHVTGSSVGLGRSIVEAALAEGHNKVTHAAGEATAGDSPILHAAIGLAEESRTASEEIERGRRIPPDLAMAMKDAGIFGMTMPRSWGGPEVDPL